MKILALIPARSGSKRVLNKNIKPIAGQPLIAWTIRAAKEANISMDIVISTDCPEIASTAASYGADVPFLRPKALSTAKSDVFETIEYTLKALSKRGQEYDHLILLQPSSPLRQSHHIEEAFAFFKEKKSQGLISVSPLNVPMQWCMPLPETLSLNDFIQDSRSAVTQRSQDLRPYYHLNGAIYIAKISSLLNYRSFYFPTGDVYAYIMNAIDGIDIDTPDDFDLASYYLCKRYKLEMNRHLTTASSL